jgi:hypothetical protein
MFPIFIVLFFGMIEFGFLFNAQLSLNFATRDASLLAAEAGSGDSNADCVILRKVDEDLSPPTDRTRIHLVHIFQANATGASTGLEQVYERTGSMVCPGGGTVPYSPYGAQTFPYSTRCAQLLGCGTNQSEPLDTIGVRIDYQYTYVTPMFHLIGGSGSSQAISSSNSMRMEPYTL